MDSKIQPGRNVILPYIDDINVVGTTTVKVNRDQRRAAAALASVNLQTDTKKDFFAGDSLYRVAIGLSWWSSEGVLTVKPAHALRLFKITNAIVCSKRASLERVRHITGLWTYALLLRHPAFSILYHTFRLLEQPGVSATSKQRVPDSVVEELSALLDVFPLLFADLRQPLSPRIYFSDACRTGDGVEYVDLSPRDARSFKDNVAETRARKGRHSSFLSFVEEDESDITYASLSPAVTSRPLKASKRFERAG